jgi:hypothetical protein
MNELDTDEMEMLHTLEEKFNERERKRLLDGLYVLLNNPTQPEAMLVNSENLEELLSYRRPLYYYAKRYEDKKMFEDLAVCYSLLLNIQQKCPPSMRDTVNECIEMLKTVLERAGSYPEAPYEYYKQYYPYYGYGYPKSKQQRYEEAVEKTRQELMKEQETMSQYDKFDIVMAGLLKSKIGSEETFKKKYIEEAPSLDETLIDVCKSISQELSNEAENVKKHRELIQKLSNTEKDLEEEKKRVEEFRTKVLNAWIEAEAKRLKGEV